MVLFISDIRNILCDMWITKPHPIWITYKLNVLITWNFSYRIVCNWMLTFILLVVDPNCRFKFFLISRTTFITSFTSLFSQEWFIPLWNFLKKHFCVFVGTLMFISSTKWGKIGATFKLITSNICFSVYCAAFLEELFWESQYNLSLIAE